MPGSSFGTIFRVTTWGESHGPALGAVVDGCPAGLPLSEEDFLPLMARRRPGSGLMSTARKEEDRVEILSGIFEGKTAGTPISLLIRNTDHHSADYSDIAEVFRPGHADYGYQAKYGIRDYRGGGRSSGRETAARVAAAVIAEKLLLGTGITFSTEVISVGGIPYAQSEEAVREARSSGDSLGSEVLCKVHGVPAGIGDPVFGKLDAKLSEAIFSIGGVKALDIGDGRAASVSRGSLNNDPFRMEDSGVSKTASHAVKVPDSIVRTSGRTGSVPDGIARTAGHAGCVPGRIVKTSNHAGGILGGISDGSNITLRVYFKPTPSISLPQKTVNLAGENTDITIHGRHDPVIGPRAAVVVEAMASLVLADAMLINMASRYETFLRFYGA